MSLFALPEIRASFSAMVCVCSSWRCHGRLRWLHLGLASLASPPARREWEICTEDDVSQCGLECDGAPSTWNGPSVGHDGLCMCMWPLPAPAPARPHFSCPIWRWPQKVGIPQPKFVVFQHVQNLHGNAVSSSARIAPFHSFLARSRSCSRMLNLAAYTFFSLLTATFLSATLAPDHNPPSSALSPPTS